MAFSTIVQLYTAICLPEDNIKMYLQEVIWEGIDWIDQALDRELQKWKYASGFHKTQGIWLAEDLLVSQEKLHSMELGWF